MIKYGKCRIVADSSLGVRPVRVRYGSCKMEAKMSLSQALGRKFQKHLEDRSPPKDEALIVIKGQKIDEVLKELADE